jgi:hypothetical protein
MLNMVVWAVRHLPDVGAGAMFRHCARYRLHSPFLASGLLRLRARPQGLAAVAAMASQRYRQVVVTLAMMCMIQPAQAQSFLSAPTNGKIYVVLAVVLVGFIGIVLLLIRLDRRLTQLENQISVEDEP